MATLTWGRGMAGGGIRVSGGGGWVGGEGGKGWVGGGLG